MATSNNDTLPEFQRYLLEKNLVPVEYLISIFTAFRKYLFPRAVEIETFYR
jgi:hypothetical protein